MTTFSPPIESRSTEDLIAIKFASTEYWQQEAIDQAQKELTKRGVSREEEKRLTDNLAKEIKHSEAKEQLRLEKNAVESYTTFKKVEIFFASPLILLGKYYMKDSLSMLNAQNYKLKYKQRLSMLVSGSLFWILVLWLMSKT
jgi:hypothetical protein